MQAGYSHVIETPLEIFRTNCVKAKVAFAVSINAVFAFGVVDSSFALRAFHGSSITLSNNDVIAFSIFFALP